jgi:hypothetical protein
MKQLSSGYFLAGLGVALFSFMGLYQLLVTQKNRALSLKSSTKIMRNDHEDIFALLKKPKIEEKLIIQELKDHPKSAEITDEKGRLPLHIVLTKPRPSFEIGLNTLPLSF